MREVKVENILLNIDLTFGEFKEWMYKGLPHSKIELFGAWFCAILFPIVGLWNLLAKTPFALQSSLFTVVGFAMLYSLTLGSHLRVKKLWPQEHPDSKSFSALLNSEGIMFILSQEDDFAAWSSMTLRETKNLFAIFRDEQPFAALPKRAFANAADLEQFRAWASGIGQKNAPPAATIPQP